MSDEIQNFEQLRKVIHISLRMEHPEWVTPNGDCPNCDDYVSRLGDLLEASSVRWPEQRVKQPATPGSPREIGEDVVQPGDFKTHPYAIGTRLNAAQ